VSESNESKETGRSVLAVLAGMLTVVALDVGIDSILHATGVYPPWGKPMVERLFLLAMAYRIVDSITGGYVAARLAASRPMLHAMILGGIGVALSLAGAVLTWSKGPEFGPKWFPVALVALAWPCARIGGAIRVRQLSRADVNQAA
jgi:hypothetical protein